MTDFALTPAAVPPRTGGGRASTVLPFVQQVASQLPAVGGSAQLTHNLESKKVKMWVTTRNGVARQHGVPVKFISRGDDIYCVTHDWVTQ